MCGITGFIDYRKNSDKSLLDQMRDSITYRGPDSAGSAFFERERFSLGLGHRRLSILDLSELGNQPMSHEHLTIIHNGEVYNFEAIKEELVSLGYAFRSHTDTEVILKAFHAWGVVCVEKFRGMFAFAIYDSKEEKLFLFRDRAGVKPLYYARKEGVFLFGSELKTLMVHPAFEKRIDRRALPYYFRFGYIPAPLTIFEDTRKLRPGHYLVCDLAEGSVVEKAYWRVEEYFLQEKSGLHEAEVLERLEEILGDAFALRMVADVPVGVFLSGGVDSSLVAALLQKASDTPLKTFTIGFEEEGFDEAQFAREIAAHLGTEHTEYYCTKEDMLSLIESLPELYDEPFGDSSAIPTLLVSKLAKEKVSVVLSGDGGDEAFIGYSKYFALAKLARLQRSPLKRGVLRLVTGLLSEESVERLNSVLPASIRQKNIKDKYQKFKNALESDDLAQMFINASSYVDTKTLRSVLKESEADFSLSAFSVLDRVKGLDPIDQMSLCDYKTFMVDDVLTKVDRASMAVSLEAREPLLDHTIIEFVARLPAEMKYREGEGKYLLKKILYKYVPKKLIERPKSGFQIPLERWLRSDLKPLVTHYLDPKRLETSGIYNTEAIAKLLDRLYQSDKFVNFSLIWFILMFEMWRERWDVICD